MQNLLYLVIAILTFVIVASQLEDWLMGRPWRQYIGSSFVSLVWSEGKVRRGDPPASIAHRLREGSRNRYGGPEMSHELRPRYFALSIIGALAAACAVYAGLTMLF